MNNIIKPREANDDYVAIFRSRTDGDWEFVAGFSEDQAPELSPESRLPMLQTLKDAINDENDDWLVVWSSEPDWPSVWSDGSNSQTKDV